MFFKALYWHIWYTNLQNLFVFWVYVGSSYNDCIENRDNNTLFSLLDFLFRKTQKPTYFNYFNDYMA